MRIWDLATRTQQAVFVIPWDSRSPVPPAESIVGDDGRVYLDERSNWVEAVCPVRVAGRDLLASGGNDGTVRIWDPAAREQRAVLAGHQGPVTAACKVRVAGRDLLASAGDDAMVRIWDPATGKRQAALKGHRRTVMAVCPVRVAGQDLLASAGDDAMVRIWDLATGQTCTLMRVAERLSACVWIDLEGVAAAGDAGLYGFDFLSEIHSEPSRS